MNFIQLISYITFLYQYLIHDYIPKQRLGKRCLTCVAELGVAPSLGDYEPPVQLYTTPRYIKMKLIIPH
jgi:hypothetical protein